MWTLTYVINEDQSVTIHNFHNEDNDGYMFAKQLPVLDYIKEEGDRVAVEVSIAGKQYTVANPQNVFTYKQPL